MANKAETSDELLQAVIISDSYNSRFRPLTNDIPRCLLPLANTPLIEYTLEFLASSGVQQVFIFVCYYADQIREYVKQSKWSLPSAPFEIKFIPTPDSMSTGDALRELDAKQLITSDFILLSGDVVSNMAADEIVAEHRKRRELNKDSIMTMVVREIDPSNRTRPSLDSAVFVIDSETSQCISYTPLRHVPRTKHIALDTEVLLKHENVEIRNDLIDCNIDICSPDVPALFTENFDYEHIRRDFVHGILTSDLLGKTIHCYVANETYSARVASLQTYDAVSKDIIARWTYPMVPDNNILPDQSYKYQRSHIYTEDDVLLARSAILASRVVIGAQTRVGANSTIDKSIIGRSCQVGSNCVISESYLWQNVVIGDGSKVTHAILADNVVIGRNCVIEEGVVIGAGVTISDGMTVPASTKLHVSEDDEAIDEALVGSGSNASVYVDEDSDDDDDDSDDEASVTQDKILDVGSLVYRMRDVNFSDTSVSSIASSEDSDDLRDRRGSMAASTFSEDDPNANFHATAAADLLNAIENNHLVEDTILELMTLRMQENVSMHDVRQSILSAWLKELTRLLQSGKPLGVTVQKFIARWGLLLRKTISPQTVSEDCLDTLLLFQLECSRTPERLDLVQPLLKFMYDDDILPEEQIIEWFESPKSKEQGDAAMKVRSKSAAFVTWLQEAEETSDEDDEESE